MAINLAALAILTGLAVIIFTPTARELAQSPIFPAWVISAIGSAALGSVLVGLWQGSISPLVRGLGEYDRIEHPKRYWASLVYNAGAAALMFRISFTIFADVEEVTCTSEVAAQDTQTVLAACDSVVAAAETPEELGDAYDDRGTALFLRGRYGAALANYTTSLEHDTSKSSVFFNRGLTFERLGDHGRAVQDYTAAVRVDPKNAEAYLNRGLIYLDSWQPDRAIADFTKAHHLDPDDPWSLANRGLAYEWLGNRERSAEDFASVDKMDPDNPVLLRGRALASFHDQDFDGAIEHLEAALDVDPKDVWSLKKRADAYWEMGDLDRARDEDDRIAELLKANE